jgi:cell filamentation protein
MILTLIRHPAFQKNRLDIADQATLEQTEAAFAATRSYELSQAPLKGSFDLVHLQAIHRYLFGDVYGWAGQLAQWTSARAAIGLPLSPADFSARAAYYLAELNALHPFREGNGRTQREFLSQLAHANGYYIAREHLSQADILTAAIQSFTVTPQD